MKHLMVIAGLAIAGWTAPAWSQDSEQLIAEAIAQGAPTQTTGVEVTVVPGVIPLGAYFESLQGSRFRARVIVLLPGAKIAVHAHDKRPGMVHVLEGEMVEHRSDSREPVIRRQGDTFYEGPGLVHWSENVSPDPVRIFAADILPGDPE